MPWNCLVFWIFYIIDLAVRIALNFCLIKLTDQMITLSCVVISAPSTLNINFKLYHCVCMCLWSVIMNKNALRKLVLVHYCFLYVKFGLILALEIQWLIKYNCHRPICINICSQIYEVSYISVRVWYSCRFLCFKYKSIVVKYQFCLFKDL